MPPAIIGGAIAATGAIGGALIGSSGSKSASKAQEDAAKYAADIQWKMYEQNREDLLPFLEAEKARLPYSEAALKEYDAMRKAGPGEFESSPYYQTLMGTVDMMTEAAAKRGAASGVGGGAVQKSLLRDVIPLAGSMREGFTNEWLQTKLNPLASEAMVGQTPYSSAAGQLSQNALVSGQNIGQSAIAGGEAIASGYLGRSASLSNALNTVGQYGALYGLTSNQNNLANYSQW